MTDETVSATTTISTSAESVFAVLADPSRHAAIDGTGWVRDSLDVQRLTGSGQIFRIAMYHDNHPDGSYEMANRVLVFEPPRVISWEPFPPFTPDHLDNSLSHLADRCAPTTSPSLPPSGGGLPTTVVQRASRPQPAADNRGRAARATDQPLASAAPLQVLVTRVDVGLRVNAES